MRLAAGLLLAAPGFAQIHVDGDELPSLWRQRYMVTTGPEADPDGDGFTNAQEAVAGTDPHCPNCRPHIAAVDFSAGNSVRLRWPAQIGKGYRVMVSRDLRTWMPAATGLVGAGPEFDITLPLTRSEPPPPAGVPVRRWDALPEGSGINAVKTRAAGGTPPDRVLFLPALKLAQSSPDVDRFGHHVAGWLVPPADGEYRFMVAGDDVTEFWLAPNASPSAVARVAHVSGWTGANEWTKYETQTSAPVSLLAGRAYAFAFYHVEGTGGDHFTVAWTGPGLDPVREPLSAAYLTAAPLALGDYAAGGSVFFRVEIHDIDSDGDGVTDHEEALLGLDSHRAMSAPNRPDLTAALERLRAGNRITLGAPESRAYETGALPARVTFFRSGNIAPLTLRYTVSGSASAGVDYEALPGVLHLPAAQNQIDLWIRPLPDELVEPAESVVITLLEDAAYTLGTPASATVMIDDAPDERYAAALRPVSGDSSGAWGSAVLRAAGNGLFSIIEINHSALQSPQTSASLYVSTTGDSPGSPSVFALPVGQVENHRWEFTPAAGHDAEALVNALREGRLWLRIATVDRPDGEILGRFTLIEGSTIMPAPAAPPPAPTGPVSAAQASRFLHQATFGPTPAAIAELQSLGYEAWFDAQRLAPASQHRPRYLARRAELLALNPDDDGWQSPRQQAWWQIALTGEDQLRQRMAWALSQILVVSQVGALDIHHEATALYYDQLADHAFGNYRDLLEVVTKSPVMGVYLSMMRNMPPDRDTGQRPDENYAREIMQLFTIGLHELHPDGTRRLDHEGRPIPTYGQDDIVGLAHVFTGWGPHYDAANPPRWSNNSVASRRDWYRYGYDALRPMTFYPEFHAPGEKRIVRGGVVPDGTDGEAAMDIALDALFHHPSAGPFLARQLIQRFVTSNPSPGYVYRVASAFANNGAGVRGDLGATLRAVLLDPEARALPAPGDISRGLRREPVLRMSAVHRAFPLSLHPPRPGSGGNLYLNHQYNMGHQAPLLSPSVFNFFQPVYSHPGRIATAGLLSPEFQVTSETTVVVESNLIDSTFDWGVWTGELLNPSAPQDDATNPWLVLRPDVSGLVAELARTDRTAAQNVGAVLDQLDLLLLEGRMSPALRAELVALHDALPSWYFGTSDLPLRASRRAALAGAFIQVITSAPEYVIHR